MNVVFGNSGRLLLAILSTRSPKSVTGQLLSCLPFFLPSWIFLAHFFKNLSTHCCQIHSALSKLSNGSKFSNVSKQIHKGGLPVFWDFPNLNQMILPLTNGRMLLLQKPSHPYFLPLVERTEVGLLHPFGKIHREFVLLQADQGFPLCAAQVRLIVAHIMCTIYDIGNVQQRGQLRIPCDICLPRHCWGLESFRWEANGGSPRCAEGMFRWRIGAAWYCWMDWIISWRFWRHSRCTWR